MAFEKMEKVQIFEKVSFNKKCSISKKVYSLKVIKIMKSRIFVKNVIQLRYIKIPGTILGETNIFCARFSKKYSYKELIQCILHIQKLEKMPNWFEDKI